MINTIKMALRFNLEKRLSSTRIQRENKRSNNNERVLLSRTKFHSNSSIWLIVQCIRSIVVLRRCQLDSFLVVGRVLRFGFSPELLSDDCCDWIRRMNNASTSRNHSQSSASRSLIRRASRSSVQFLEGRKEQRDTRWFIETRIKSNPEGRCPTESKRIDLGRGATVRGRNLCFQDEIDSFRCVKIKLWVQ